MLEAAPVWLVYRTARWINEYSRMRETLRLVRCDSNWAAPGVCMAQAAAAAISSKAISTAEARQLLRHFSAHASPCLAFASRVQALTVRRWQPHAPSPTVLLHVSVAASGDTGRVATDGKEWKKFSVSSLFGGSYASSRLHELTLSRSEGDAQPTSDLWVVASSTGAGRTRDLALERRYLSFLLSPVAAVAVHVARDGVACLQPLQTEEAPTTLVTSSNETEGVEDGSSGERVGGDDEQAEQAADAAAARVRAQEPEESRPTSTARLFAPLPLPHSEPGQEQHPDVSRSALQQLPFAVMGHFALRRAGGRTLSPLAELAGPSWSATAQPTGSSVSSSSHPESTHTAAAVATADALKATWNVAQLANVSAATALLLEALPQHAAVRATSAGHTTCYSLWPVDTHLAHASDAAAVRALDGP